MTVAPIRKQLVVNATQERCFRIFTAGIDKWWARDHHIGKSPLKELIIEPKVGGRWYAVCQDGSEVDTGRVLVWEPSARVVLTWQISAQWQFDPALHTEVEVRFVPEGPRKTRVELEHRKLEAFGADAEKMHTTFDADTAWVRTLAQFSNLATEGPKAVVLYTSAPDVMTTAPLHYAAHKARVDAFHARGDLLAIGTFADPREGAMAVFRSRMAAESFVADDPFVLEGVVTHHEIKDWSETLL